MGKCSVVHCDNEATRVIGRISTKSEDRDESIKPISVCSEHYPTQKTAKKRK